MMASSSIVSNNPDAAVDSTRKKRHHNKLEDDDGNQASITQLRWRSDNEQRIYSARLMEAIRKVRQGSSSSSPAAVGKTVKAAADKVLAAAARGTTRWSRAILTSRLRLQRSGRSTRVHQKSKKSAAKVFPGRRRIIERSTTRLPVLQKKVKVLSRLVPGCRKAPLSNLLEETTDYIAALEMQVRAMTVLTELLSGAPANAIE